jgi:hypothetical protein
MYFMKNEESLSPRRLDSVNSTHSRAANNPDPMHLIAPGSWTCGAYLIEIAILKSGVGAPLPKPAKMMVLIRVASLPQPITSTTSLSASPQKKCQQYKTMRRLSTIEYHKFVLKFVRPGLGKKGRKLPPSACTTNTTTTTTSSTSSTTLPGQKETSELHRPGIEPGASRCCGWQRLILPLNHRCGAQIEACSIDEVFINYYVYIAAYV